MSKGDYFPLTTTREVLFSSSKITTLTVTGRLNSNLPRDFTRQPPPELLAGEFTRNIAGNRVKIGLKGSRAIASCT